MQEQWNEGLPPAGEAGMCFTNCENGVRVQFWTGKHFGLRGLPGCMAGAFVERQPSITQDAPWRFATLDECEGNREWCHQSMLDDAPWLPPQQDGFGPWVEHDGADDLPVDKDRIVQALKECERKVQRFEPLAARADLWEGEDTVAYCVKLEAAQGETPGAGKYRENVKIERCSSIRFMNFAIFGPETQTIAEPVWVGSDWSAEGLNERMLASDDAGAEPKRARPLPPVDRAAIAAMIAEIRREGRDEAVAEQAFVEHGFGHRLGKFV